MITREVRRSGVGLFSIAAVLLISFGEGALAESDPQVPQVPSEMGVSQQQQQPPAQHDVTVAPDTNLRDGQSVQVTSRGWPPGATVGIAMCNPQPMGSDDCDVGQNAKLTTASTNGTVQTDFTVRATARTNRQGTIQCPPRNCSVGLATLNRSDVGWRVVQFGGGAAAGPTGPGGTPGAPGPAAARAGGGRTAQTGINLVALYALGVGLIVLGAAAATWALRTPFARR